MRMVNGVLAILEGKTEELRQELETRMQAAAEALDFEQAARLRDRLLALAGTTERQVIASGEALDQDVFGLHRKDASLDLLARNAEVLHRKGDVVADAGEHDFRLRIYPSVILTQVRK